MRELYIKGGHGFILVFSLISKTTFKEMDQYYSQVMSVKDEPNVRKSCRMINYRFKIV